MTGTSTMTKRVMAIDDDETILAVMNNALKMHDYEAVTATQWVEALDILNEGTPDLLLLDLQMPHVDGFFLLEWIREQEIDLPVIVVSGYLNDDATARLETLGVDAFVWKPFNVTELIAKIDELLGTAPRTEDGAPEVPAGPTELLEQEAISGEPAEAESEGAEEVTPRRRRVRRRRKGARKRQRRRTALFLAVIAIVSLGISGLNVYMRNIAATVERPPSGPSPGEMGEGDLLKELLRAQITSQLEAERRAQQPPPKKLELDLQRK